MGKPTDEDVTKWVQCFLGATSTAVVEGLKAGVVTKPLGDAIESVVRAAPQDAREPGKSDGKSGGEASKAKTAGQPGKFSNRVFPVGNYVISIPAAPEGKVFPLVVLFAGNTKKKVMLDQTPQSYYENAILVYGERDGSFAAVKTSLDKLLAENGTSFGKASMCGYSSGGQAALRNYNAANFTWIGFIDPTIYKSDLKKLDSRAIFSASRIKGNWDTVINSKGENAYDGRLAALDKKNSQAGVVEETKVSHGTYPGAFLADHESKLL